MCLVMVMTKELQFHTFSLELRPEKNDIAAQEELTGGFYVYSSWAGRFSIQWFLGYAERMRSNIPKEEDLFELYPHVSDADEEDKKHENLKTFCGNMKFLKIDDLRKCLEKFALIFDKENFTTFIRKNVGVEKLSFVFECKKLNEKFRKLN